MWVKEVFTIVWKNLFSIQIPIFGGISFGTIMICVFIASALIGLLSDINSRG